MQPSNRSESVTGPHQLVVYGVSDRITLYMHRKVSIVKAGCWKAKIVILRVPTAICQTSAEHHYVSANLPGVRTFQQVTVLALLRTLLLIWQPPALPCSGLAVAIAAGRSRDFFTCQEAKKVAMDVVVVDHADQVPCGGNVFDDLARP